MAAHCFGACKAGGKPGQSGQACAQSVCQGACTSTVTPPTRYVRCLGPRRPLFLTWYRHCFLLPPLSSFPALTDTLVQPDPRLPSYLHTAPRLHTQIRAHAHIHTRAKARSHARTQMHVHTTTQKWACAHTHAHNRACSHIHTHANAHIHTCIYANARAHTHLGRDVWCPCGGAAHAQL